MEDKPEVKIEILRAEHIKPEIRDIHKLPESGIVIKKSTRTSPSQDFYEPVNSPFLDRLNLNLNKLSSGVLDKLKSLK